MKKIISGLDREDWMMVNDFLKLILCNRDPVARSKKKLEGKELIVIIGEVNTGKSTIGNILAGVEYDRSDESGAFVPKKRGEEYFEVRTADGDGTQLPKVFQIEPEICLIDTPGFGEHGRKGRDLFTTMALNQITAGRPFKRYILAIKSLDDTTTLIRQLDMLLKGCSSDQEKESILHRLIIVAQSASATQVKDFQARFGKPEDGKEESAERKEKQNRWLCWYVDQVNSFIGLDLSDPAVIQNLRSLVDSKSFAEDHTEMTSYPPIVFSLTPGLMDQMSRVRNSMVAGLQDWSRSFRGAFAFFCTFSEEEYRVLNQLKSKRDELAEICRKLTKTDHEFSRIHVEGTLDAYRWTYVSGDDRKKTLKFEAGQKPVLILEGTLDVKREYIRGGFPASSNPKGGALTVNTVSSEPYARPFAPLDDENGSEIKVASNPPRIDARGNKIRDQEPKNLVQVEVVDQIEGWDFKEWKVKATAYARSRDHIPDKMTAYKKLVREKETLEDEIVELASKITKLQVRHATSTEAISLQQKRLKKKLDELDREWMSFQSRLPKNREPYLGKMITQCLDFLFETDSLVAHRFVTRDIKTLDLTYLLSSPFDGTSAAPKTNENLFYAFIWVILFSNVESEDWVRTFFAENGVTFDGSDLELLTDNLSQNRDTLLTMRYLPMRMLYEGKPDLFEKTLGEGRKLKETFQTGSEAELQAAVTGIATQYGLNVSVLDYERRMCFVSHQNPKRVHMHAVIQIYDKGIGLKVFPRQIQPFSNSNPAWATHSEASGERPAASGPGGPIFSTQDGFFFPGSKGFDSKVALNLVKSKDRSLPAYGVIYEPIFKENAKPDNKVVVAIPSGYSLVDEHNLDKREVAFEGLPEKFSQNWIGLASDQACESAEQAKSKSDTIQGSLSECAYVLAVIFVSGCWEDVFIKTTYWKCLNGVLEVRSKSLSSGKLRLTFLMEGAE